MKNTTWFLSKRLMVEQRYLAMKSSTKFQDRISRNYRNKTKALETYINTSYIVSAVSFLFFSVFLVSPYILGPDAVKKTADMSFLLFIYSFIVSVYSSILFFNTLHSYKLIEPLKPMPMKLQENVIPLSWFAYTGSTAIFIVLPALIMFTFFFDDLLSLFFGIIWTVVTIMLGYSVGSTIFVYLSSKMDQKKSSIVNSLKGMIRILFIILIFILFEVGVYFPQSVPNIIPTMPEVLKSFVPFVNIPYIVFLNNSTVGPILIDVLSTVVYALITMIFFKKINRKLFLKVSEFGSESRIGLKDWKKKFKLHSVKISFFLKEIRILVRKSQNVILLFIPVFFVLPTILSVFLYGDNRFSNPVSTYFSLTSIVIVCASFYSLILIISEGNGIDILFSLPLRLRDIIYSKALVGLIAFSAIVTPVTFLLLLPNSNVNIIDLLIPFNLILSYLFISLFNIRRLLRKLPTGVSTVNFYSFGGNIAFVVLFVISTTLLLIPMGLSTLASFLFFKSPFTNPQIFYSLNAIMNIAALLVVVNRINQN